MGYSTFGNYRYTLKDSARRARKSRVSLASSYSVGIECPHCPLAREKKITCTSDYHNGQPMKYPKGKP
jgi:hypothetical protein